MNAKLHPTLHSCKGSLDFLFLPLARAAIESPKHAHVRPSASGNGKLERQDESIDSLFQENAEMPIFEDVRSSHRFFEISKTADVC